MIRKVVIPPKYRTIVSYATMFILFLSGCNQLSVDDGEGAPYNYYFSGPYNFSVQSIAPTVVKIAWASGYKSPVIVERSAFKDSLYTVIQRHDSAGYFYDSTVAAPRVYYYRFRGYTAQDTSYYTSLTIGYDSSSVLLQSVSTNKSTSSLTISDDGTFISIVDPDWGGFEKRRYSDLSLVETRNRGDLYVAFGSENRFSSDANKIATWNGSYAASITLAPYDEIQMKIPDSIAFYDMYYILNDTKILALASSYESQRSIVYLFDLQTKAFVQRIDTLKDAFSYGTSYISGDRSKVLIQTSAGFCVITTSPSLSVKDISMPSSYVRFAFLNGSNNILAAGYSFFAFINSGTGAVYKNVAASITNITYRMAVYPDDSRVIPFDSYVRDVSVYNLTTGANEQRVGSINPDLTVTGVCCGKNDQSFIILYSNGTINKYSTVEFAEGWQKRDGS